MEQRDLPYEIEFSFVLYGLKESMEGYSSLYVYLCMKNWEIRLKASRLWQNFLKTMCRKLQQAKEALIHARKCKLRFQCDVGTLNHMY